MLYLSVALTFIAIIFTAYPPTITIRKIMIVDEPEPKQATTTTEEVDIAKLNEDAPPSLDEVTALLNEVLHGISGGEDDE